MLVSHWIRISYVVVPSALVYGKHAVASEILARSGGSTVVSHRIRTSYAVVSAALVYQEHAVTSEISSEDGGKMLVSQWHMW
jgi:hypothetical protein